MELTQQLIQAQSWEARYRLIIQAGKNLPKPNEAELATMQLIDDCEVNLWFRIQKNSEKNDRTFSFQAYSESDRSGGAAMAGLGAVADLDKHQGLPLAHDEIDLAAPAAVVAGQGLQAAGLQPMFR